MERNSKERNCLIRCWPITVPIDAESVSLIERIAAENKYLREGRENKQIIPSLIDFITGRFYIVILFTKWFHGIADFAFQTQLKVCVQNKGVVRHLFGRISISYMNEVSYFSPCFSFWWAYRVCKALETSHLPKVPGKSFMETWIRSIDQSGDRKMHECK